MNPFRISTKDYPSYKIVEQIVNVDDLSNISAEREVAVGNGSRDYRVIMNTMGRAEKYIATFSNQADRDKCFEDLYQAMLESKTHVRTEYIPS